MSQDLAQDENKETTELLESIQDKFLDIDEALKRLSENVEDSSASMRMDVTMVKRELAEVKVQIARLGGRIDNQMTTLVTANIASGVGVAALVLGITHAL